LRGKCLFCELSAFAFVSLVAAFDEGHPERCFEVGSAECRCCCGCLSNRTQASGGGKAYHPHKVRAGSHIIVRRMSWLPLEGAPPTTRDHDGPSDCLCASPSPTILPLLQPMISPHPRIAALEVLQTMHPLARTSSSHTHEQQHLTHLCPSTALLSLSLA
jgi:hypothetical protein